MATPYDFPERWRPLIRRAESAFDGKVNDGIKEGFRLRRWDNKQLCAVYWGNGLLDCHCLEIAVSPTLGIGRFAYDKMVRWLEREIAATGRRGARHKGSDSWPTLGFDTEEQALEFLTRVELVRRGGAHPDSMCAGSDSLVPTQSDDRDETEAGPNGGEEAGRRTSAQALLAAFRAKTAEVPESTVAYRKAKQRIGQALLRRALMEIWGGRCGLTGLSACRLLRASHVKPWAESSDEERLNPANCLLLAPQVDAAFDVGLIAFDAAGRLLVSPDLRAEDSALLGFAVSTKLRLAPSSEQQQFLAWHRRQRFRAG